MTKKRTIQVGKATKGKNPKVTVTDKRQVDSTDVPHTQLFVNRKLGDEDEAKPEYMISHKLSGWGLLSGRYTKKAMIASAQFLWSQMPNEIVDILSTEESDSLNYNKRIKELYAENPTLQKRMVKVLQATRNYMETL